MGQGKWLGRGCLALALIVITPFVLIGVIALAGIALGAFTLSLPVLLVLGLAALVLAAVTLLVALGVRTIASRHSNREIQGAPAHRLDAPVTGGPEE
jgi:hypothetical protein